MLGKQQKIPSRKTNKHKKEERIDLFHSIHSDLMDPIQTTSYNNFRYILTFQ